MSEKPSPEIKLIDLRGLDPNSLQREREHRSLQVYECPACGWLTNRIYIDWSGLPDSQCCPNKDRLWHFDIEEKLKLCQDPHPEYYLRMMRKEILHIRNTHVKRIKHDLKGNPDLRQKRKGLLRHSFYG